MKILNSYLQPLQNCYYKNPYFYSFANIDIQRATLIAEFSIYNYCVFSLFHCVNSSNYILYIKIDENIDECYSKQYFIQESLEKSMEVVNTIIRNYFWDLGGGESVRWWSYLPDWMFVNPYFVSVHFNQFVQNTVDGIMSEINKIDLTETEKAAIQSYNVKM